MTTKFLRKTVALLVNNSFTENLLPLATLNDVDIANDKDLASQGQNHPSVVAVNSIYPDPVKSCLACIQSMYERGRLRNSAKPVQRAKNLVDKICPNSKLHFAQDAPIYQRVKRAEAILIRQFLQQSINDIYPLQTLKAKSSPHQKEAESLAIDQSVLDQSSRILLNTQPSQSTKARPFMRDYTNKLAVNQLFRFGRSILARPAFADLSDGVLISIEQIRNAILCKRSPYRLKPTGLTSRTDQDRADQRSRPVQQIRPLSEYKKHLYECRKLRVLYGNLSQKDLFKSAKRAKHIQGSLGENLITILETRLDVTLQRCGFSQQLDQLSNL